MKLETLETLGHGLAITLVAWPVVLVTLKGACNHGFSNDDE
jgi:hypothetical protein